MTLRGSETEAGSLRGAVAVVLSVPSFRNRVFWTFICVKRCQHVWEASSFRTCTFPFLASFSKIQLASNIFNMSGLQTFYHPSSPQNAKGSWSQNWIQKYSENVFMYFHFHHFTHHDERIIGCIHPIERNQHFSLVIVVQPDLINLSWPMASFYLIISNQSKSYIMYHVS